MLLEGMYLPLTTPFHADGRLNLFKLQQNVQRYSKTPASGMFVLARRGEPTMVSDAETVEIFKAAIESALPEKVMIAGIARDSVGATLTLAECAASLGYDAIIAGLPTISWGTTNPRDAPSYFQAVADRSPLPLVFASGRATDRRQIPIEVIAKLAQHPNILGLADEDSDATRTSALVAATANVKRQVTVTTIFAAVTGRMKRVSTGPEVISAAMLRDRPTEIASTGGAPLKTRTRLVGFQILAGSTVEILSGLRAGATGVAPGFGPCAPQACYEVYQAWKDDDQPLADEKQMRILAAAHEAEVVLGIAGIKYGCDLNGYFGGSPRAPIAPPTGQQKAALQQAMHGLRS